MQNKTMRIIKQSLILMTYQSLAKHTVVLDADTCRSEVVTAALATGIATRERQTNGVVVAIFTLLTVDALSIVLEKQNKKYFIKYIVQRQGSSFPYCNYNHKKFDTRQVKPLSFEI